MGISSSVNSIFKSKKYKAFLKQLDDFKKAGDQKRFSSISLFPCLNDATGNTEFDFHYVYHPAWACRIVKQINPKLHIDISSTLHFCSMLSAFITTEFYDFRPARLQLSNLKTGKADLTNLFFETESVECLSCMHTIEHIGLGRYGDRLDPNGDILAINEIKRVVKKGGDLLFVTPVGVPHLQYNAHRIYSFEMIMDYFSGFQLIEFSLITDTGDFISPANPSLVASQKYGCGCFWFKKA